MTATQTRLDEALDDRVIHLTGELDAASAGAARTAIAAVFDSSAGGVLLDCSGLTFVGAAGLGALVWAANRADADGRRFGLVAVTPGIQRLLVVSGLRRRFGVPLTAAPPARPPLVALAVEVEVLRAKLERNGWRSPALDELVGAVDRLR